MAKKALITGITGQDGSYLAEFLLHKGYEVHGIIRRTSTFNTQRIDHIYVDPHMPKARFFLHYGDVADSEQLSSVIYNVRPDEVYHLSAQSHVRVSFDMAEYTGNVTGLGTTRILEILKRGKINARFYQASSSEMFGKSPAPQNEDTPLMPRSPYAIAKAYAYWMALNYREGHNIFACNGILFNHETITSFMPMFCKTANEEEFDIKPIREIVRFDETNKRYQSKKVSGIQIWGKKGWVGVTFASAYPHDTQKDNKYPRFINSRSGGFMTTADHIVFMDGNREKKAKDIEVGERLEIVDLPQPSVKSKSPISKEEAELMGMMVGDGSITFSKKGIGVHGKFTNSSDKIRKWFDYLWTRIIGGHTVYYPSKSGFNPEKTVGQLILVGGNDWLRKIDIYNNDRTKRIPKVILNSSPDIMSAFLKGYNITDGLKENPCVYEFKNFKTNSATLAMGLWYLIDKTTKQDINLTLEIKQDGRLFYSLNILSTVENLLKEEKVKYLIPENLSQREISRRTQISRDFIRKIQYGGSCCVEHHLRKDPLAVKKIVDLPEYDGWFYDLETTSGEFHCGIGKCRVHNSPRRGETFVTRKITRAVANIIAGKQKKLYLGNLKAKRDWGFAPEFVTIMWKILQQNKPSDYVIGTGRAHSVEELVKNAFSYAGLDYKKYLEIDKDYFRPTEVDDLVADPGKAKRELDWQPKVTFEDLVKILVDSDMRSVGLKPIGEGDRIISQKFPDKWWKAD